MLWSSSPTTHRLLLFAVRSRTSRYCAWLVSLILVDQDMLEQLLVVREHVRVLLQEPDREHQQVVEIHAARFPEPLRVQAVVRYTASSKPNPALLFANCSGPSGCS